jgi:hypothetical protein
MTAFSKVSSRKQLLLGVAVLALAVLSLGQDRQTQVSSQGVVHNPNCQSTFNYGSGQTLFDFCVTSDGNLIQFTSPQGFEHIQEGVIGEGYGICDTDLNAAYFDYAQRGASGNWNNPVIAQPGGPNTFPLKMTRVTSDRVFALTQSFSRNPGERIVKITMTIKNTSSVGKAVILLRYADIDANNADHGDYLNEFDYGFESVWGYNTGSYGLGLSLVPTSVSHSELVWDNASAPDTCTPRSNLATTPFLGDGSAGIMFFFPLAAGKSKTVSVEYQRF